MRKEIFILIGLGSLNLSAQGYSVKTPSFTIKNNSAFYLFNNDISDHPNCPKQINPGETVTTSEYWCGFVSCATSDYSQTQSSCMEIPEIGSTDSTQGGYATWFSISPGGASCSVPTTNSYTCTFDSQGNFNLTYKPIIQLYSAGPQAGSAVVLPKPATYTTSSSSPSTTLRGINISGMEYDGTFLDALYQKPDIPDALYFVQQGMNIIRFPIRWEFLFSNSSAPEDLIENNSVDNTTVNTMYMNAILDTLEKYLSNGLYVILDLHNYMRFCEAGSKIGQGNEPTFPSSGTVNNCTIATEDQLAKVWTMLANQIKNKFQGKYLNQLYFGIMNEPYSVPGNQDQTIKTEDVFNTEVSAAKAIQTVLPSANIILSGNFWDPLHVWTSSPIPGMTANSDVFTSENLASRITDLSHIFIEVHQYFDTNFSGTHQACNSYKDYNDFKTQLNLDNFVQWMNNNKIKVLLTEFGGSTDQNCVQDIDWMLQFVEENAYPNANGAGFVGWTVWRANRHGNAGFGLFNFLQSANYDVYGGNGTSSSAVGTAIVPGQGNPLMQSVFAKHLTPVTSKP